MMQALWVIVFAEWLVSAAQVEEKPQTKCERMAWLCRRVELGL